MALLFANNINIFIVILYCWLLLIHVFTLLFSSLHFFCLLRFECLSRHLRSARFTLSLFPLRLLIHARCAFPSFSRNQTKKWLLIGMKCKYKRKKMKWSRFQEYFESLDIKWGKYLPAAVHDWQQKFIDIHLANSCYRKHQFTDSISANGCTEICIEKARHNGIAKYKAITTNEFAYHGHFICIAE